jgi:glycosyltransferase involved in cell wall biosynthesis
VYLPLSQGPAGFFRDSLLIDVSAASGWQIAAHLRGGEFLDFYQRLSVPWRIWIRATLRRLGSVAVLSPHLRWMFSGFLPKARIAVVPNGTPDIGPGSEAVRRDDRTVLFLSNLRRRKGVEPSLDAAILVLQHLPDARFLFVGEWEGGELQRELTRRAAPWGDRIRFLPPMSGEAKLRLLRSASILLFPPIKPEGHPRVVIEAISAGMPVVATDRGAIVDTVVDGQSGFVLPEPDPQELAERLLLLLTDDDLRRRMGDAARRRYLEHFTQDRADRALVDWLAGVLR